jgi:adenosine deaminase
MNITPLAAMPITPEILALPKADIHIHQEMSPRLNRVLAKRAGRKLYDWHEWSTRLMADNPPGSARLGQIGEVQPEPKTSDTPENLILRLVDLLEEAARDGAIFVEVRPGYSTVIRPDFMALFREAEEQVQARYPQFCAEAIACLQMGIDHDAADVVIENCISVAKTGLSGVDFLYQPYETEADWSAMYRMAAPLAAAGLGITVHAGEMSTANIVAASRVPGLTRIGHGIYAAYDPHLLDLLLKRNITLECSLTCNVILGAAPSYETHPIHQLVADGIPVALCTDDPVQICTTIGREYALAYALGFSAVDLLQFTRNAINAAFTTSTRRSTLLQAIDTWSS